MSKQISFKGAKIAYTVNGTGKAVVLLHGFLEDRTMWNELVNKLSASCKVIAIDLPGFGDSGMISEKHSMKTMAEAVNAVINNEGILRCTMIGHSMGGYVTLAYADLFIDKLNSIVLFHSQAAADDEETKLVRNRTIKIVESSHASFISSFIPSLFTDENAIKFKEEIREIIKRSLLTKNEGIIAALAGMRDRMDFIKLLSQLEIPILFIAGKLDSRIPVNKITEQIEIPKFSESLILDNVGHMGFIEAKEITFNTIAQFVNK
ncbi:MAG: alpha/beta hydrolase [Bacteroidota bacterium]